MKELFYQLSNTRSFAKLFSLLACIALGPLFPQQASAQFEFGWEPFPPSSWDGGWDPILNCGALNGTTKLTRTPPSGPDTVEQTGTVSCTFTDDARTPVFQETATCKLHIKVNNLGESCANNGTNPASSTLTVTGICPTATVSKGAGTIDCSGGGTGGADPTFCLYAGSDPEGNTSGKCVWNIGWGAKKGQNVVPMTQNQCQAVFGTTRLVYSFSQILEGAVCAQNAQIIDMGETSNKFCHSDTWDPAQEAFCDLQGTQVKNLAEATVANFLTVDTEYSPATINADCRPGKDQGDITLTVLGNNLEPHSTNNSIAVQAINQATITVNGFAPASCSFPNPDTLACRVPSCINGHSILEGHITGKTATLAMEACLGTLNEFGECVGTRIVGDLETRKVSGL